MDGGLLSAERLGLKPDYIVGDFDTLAVPAFRVPDDHRVAADFSEFGIEHKAELIALF